MGLKLRVGLGLRDMVTIITYLYVIFIVHNNNKHVLVKKKINICLSKKKKQIYNSKHMLVCELDLLYNGLDCNLYILFWI